MIGAPRPILKRLPRRRVTIALGLLGRDYVVLGADTMESTGYAGDLKTEAVKILSGFCGDADGTGAIGISGAGDSGYLDSIKQEVVTAFTQQHMGLDDFEHYFRTRIVTFYAQHVIPFAQFPASDRPSLDLLVGVQRNGQPMLLSTDRTTVTRKTAPGSFAVVGAGQLYGCQTIGRLFSWNFDINLARVLAAYVIYGAKDNIEGCGKKTHLLTVRNNFAAFVASPLIDSLEKLFQRYGEIESRTFCHAMGYESDGTSAEQNVATLSEWLTGLRTEVKQLVSQM